MLGDRRSLEWNRHCKTAPRARILSVAERWRSGRRDPFLVNRRARGTGGGREKIRGNFPTGGSDQVDGSRRAASRVAGARDPATANDGAGKEDRPKAASPSQEIGEDICQADLFGRCRKPGDRLRRCHTVQTRDQSAPAHRFALVEAFASNRAGSIVRRQTLSDLLIAIWIAYA